MGRTTNLIQRRGRWYFNKAYPKELWPVVGPSPFRLALNTDALEQAQRMRGHAEQRYWAAVDAARKKLGEVAPRPLSEVEAVAIVSRWFLDRNAELDRSHLHLPTPPEGIRAAGFTSLPTIAKELNSRGIVTPRGGVWHPSSVRNLLSRLDSAVGG